MWQKKLILSLALASMFSCSSGKERVPVESKAQNERTDAGVGQSENAKKDEKSQEKREEIADASECGGLNQAKVAPPANPEGYLCGEVEALPDTEKPKTAPIDAARVGYPNSWLCDAEENCIPGRFDRSKAAGEAEHLKSWVCAAEKGCVCGDKPCPPNFSCTDNVCACGGKKLDGDFSDDYACLDGRLECFGESCPCGTTQCRKGSQCDDNRCLCDGKELLSAHPDFYVCDDVGGRRHWICQKRHCSCGSQRCPQNAACDDGSCTCAGVPMPKGKARWRCSSQGWVCDSSYGCNCDFGSSEEILKCPQHTICSPGGCICENKAQISDSCKCVKSSGGKLTWMCDGKEMLTEIIALERKPPYKFNALNLPECDAPDGCPCGESLCGTGEYCDGASCLKIGTCLKMNGKSHCYDNPDFDKNTSHFWSLVQNGHEIIFCGTRIPENVEDYVCDISETPCAGYPKACDRIEVRTRGWKCAQSKGCVCKSVTCPAGTYCDNGRCL